MGWEDFKETMDRVCRQRLSLPQASLSVIVNRVPAELSLERISHFENRLHKVYATLTDGRVVPLSQKLSSILESVAEQEIFLRCHQSYIVNLAHVRTLEDPFIRIQARMDGEHLLMLVENAYHGTIHEKNGKILSSKKDGGLGMLSIQRILNRPEDEFDIYFNNNTFTAMVRIGINPAVYR